MRRGDGGLSAFEEKDFTGRFFLLLAARNRRGGGRRKEWRECARECVLIVAVAVAAIVASSSPTKKVVAEGRAGRREGATECIVAAVAANTPSRSRWRRPIDARAPSAAVPSASAAPSLCRHRHEIIPHGASRPSASLAVAAVGVVGALALPPAAAGHSNHRAAPNNEGLIAASIIVVCMTVVMVLVMVMAIVGMVVGGRGLGGSSRGGSSG